MKKNQPLHYQKCNIDLEKIDNIEDVLSLICENIEELDLARFELRGFGKSLWPVDVSTDLLTILEQLPDFLIFLNDTNCQQGCLKLYEQGIEKKLFFNKHDHVLIINCKSLSNANSNNNEIKRDWGIESEEESIEIDKLIDMIGELIAVFISLSNEYFPELTNHEIFNGWHKIFIPHLKE
ncbi:MAG: hypothetical protein AAF383_25940 [Cyanobacteria bacterium P01_A01_bin.83]